MTDTKEWTPDLPLRADATDEDVHARHRQYRRGLSWTRDEMLPALAREFAAACVEADRATPWRESEAVKRLWPSFRTAYRGYPIEVAEVTPDSLNALCDAVAACAPSPASVPLSEKQDDFAWLTENWYPETWRKLAPGQANTLREAIHQLRASSPSRAPTPEAPEP